MKLQCISVRRWPAAPGKLVAAVVDQASASLTTLLVTILAASTLDARSFGRLSIMLTVIFVGTSLVRALTSVPLLTYGLGELSTTRGPAAVIAVALAVSVLCGPLIVVIGSSLGSSALGFTTAVTFAAVTASDALRYWSIAARRPTAAARLTALQLAITCLGFAHFFVWSPQDWSILLTWAAASSAVTIGAFIKMAGIQSVAPVALARAGSSIITRFRHVTPFFIVEYVLISSVVHAVVFIIGATRGLEWAAGYRVVLSIALAPLSAFYAAVMPQVQLFLQRSLSSRDLAAPPRKHIRVMAGVAAGLCVVGALWICLVEMLPDTWLEIVAGDAWTAGQHLVVSTGVLTILLTLSTAVYSDLRYRLSNGALLAAKASGGIAAILTIWLILNYTGTAIGPALILGAAIAGSPSLLLLSLKYRTTRNDWA